MLKLFFWFLVLVNGLLFSYHQGYLETLVPSGHEPARLEKQLNANQIKLIPASVATAAEPPAPTFGGDASAANATPEPVAANVDKKAEPLACVEIGNFDATDAARFAAKLAPLSLGDKVVRRIVAADTSRHIVFIPPQGSKEAADKKAGQLRNLGVKDFYVIQDNTEFRWGISLGIFSTEEAAKSHLAALGQQGVHSAKIQAYGATPGKTAFQLRQVSADANAAVEKIKAGFPDQQVRACAATS